MLPIILFAYEATKMTQGYFYTLSAIAQAFAAIVALNAVFVIYKFQLLKNHRNELFVQLRQLLLREGKLPAVEIENMTDEEILSFSRGVKDGYVNIVKRFKETIMAFDQNKSISENITKWLKISLKFNVVTIMLSLILLPWGGLLPDYLKSIILIEILFFSLFSLLITVNAILITLESGNLPLISGIFNQKSGKSKNQGGRKAK